MKSKILYVNSISEIGGAEVSLLMLLRHIDRQAFEPIVLLTAKGPLYNEVKKSGVEIVVYPMDKFKPLKPMPYLRTVLRLINILKRQRIDLIHANTDICAQYALLPAKLFKIPLVVHTRNILNKRAFRRMFLFGPDALIANSNAVLQSYLEYAPTNQRKVVIHNGVDLEAFNPDKEKRFLLRKNFSLRNSDFVIGLFARIAPEKGHRKFFRALTEVIKHYPNVKALVAGDTRIDHSGEYLEELKEIIQHLGLNGKVVFTGFVSDYIGLYSTIDLLVCPSDNEPFGRVLIEAMAMQVPVIANRSGGPMEIIEHEQNGLLVDAGDKQVFSNAIVRLLNNRVLCREIGRRGREIARKRFSIEKTAHNTQAVYQSLLEQK